MKNFAKSCLSYPGHGKQTINDDDDDDDYDDDDDE